MTTYFVEWSIRAVLLAVGTILVLRVLRIRTSAAQHAAWTGVLMVMLLMPAWTAWGPRLSIPVLPSPAEAVIEAELVESVASLPLPEVGVTPVAVPDMPKPRRVDPWTEIILALYFIGAAAMVMRLIVGTARALSLVNQATRHNDFMTSADCAAPVTVGWFRPTIVLPANWRDWPAAELDAVLVHEREHARRRDPVVQWLALLNRAIFWFHPVAWWLERKLAELAEDVCDTAVLRAGHDPNDYSEYLIDLASAVSRAGSRLPAWGSAMVGGGLDLRIQRILDWVPIAHLSRSQAMAATALCAIGLATFGACTLGRVEKNQVANLNPGQLSMNDMSKRESAERIKRSEKTQALVTEAGSFTPEQAAAKLRILHANPEDEDAHLQLMHYYSTRHADQEKNGLVLWYIEHAPGGQVDTGTIRPASDRAAYEQGKRLWLANTKKNGATADVFARAAGFLRGSDMPLAEELLMAGRSAYPDDPRWARLLGQHYAKALLGSADPGDEFRTVRSTNVSEVQDPYAKSVHARLDRTTDSEVLAWTVRWLTAWGRDPRGFSEGGTFALAESLAARALMLDPANQTAASMKFQLEKTRDYEKLRTKLSPEQREQLGDADRLLRLRSEMDQAWGTSGVNPNFYLAEAKARELLELAQKRPDIPHSAAAIFQGNFMLGKAALRQLHKGEAARYLLLAADAPPSEELRYDQMVLAMNFPRALIDWGEREVVAEFLVRVSPKTLRTKEFQDWSAEIRNGNNPEKMGPLMIGCGQEPC